MAKFSGEIGYAEETVETPPGSGVWVKEITERKAYGDIIRNTRKTSEGEYLNEDLSVNNSIRIVADAYASKHFFAIRYVRWAGSLWTVTEVTVERPRLTLRLGGVYHGPVAVETSGPPEDDSGE